MKALKSQSPSYRVMVSDDKMINIKQYLGRGLNPLPIGSWFPTEDRVGFDCRYCGVSIPFLSGHGFRRRIPITAGRLVSAVSIPFLSGHGFRQ